jgi:hypothetical protein
MESSKGFCNWNGPLIRRKGRNDWRASLVPAAAVIPAPIAYIKDVAVKKLVVGRSAKARGNIEEIGVLKADKRFEQCSMVLRKIGQLAKG